MALTQSISQVPYPRSVKQRETNTLLDAYIYMCVCISSHDVVMTCVASPPQDGSARPEQGSEPDENDAHHHCGVGDTVSCEQTTALQIRTENESRQVTAVMEMFLPLLGWHPLMYLVMLMMVSVLMLPRPKTSVKNPST